jgi:hypothetical protein
MDKKYKLTWEIATGMEIAVRRTKDFRGSLGVRRKTLADDVPDWEGIAGSFIHHHHEGLDGYTRVVRLYSAYSPLGELPSLLQLLGTRLFMSKASPLLSILACISPLAKLAGW